MELLRYNEDMHSSKQEEIELFINNAYDMLDAAQLMLNNDFYTSAINQAYYAIFYAASAVLVTIGLNRGKHSQVISEFRRHFIKTGIFDNQLSDSYGRVMGDRHMSDYDLAISISIEDAQADFVEAKAFVLIISEWLKQEGWL